MHRYDDIDDDDDDDDNVIVGSSFFTQRRRWIEHKYEIFENLVNHDSFLGGGTYLECKNIYMYIFERS